MRDSPYPTPPQEWLARFNEKYNITLSEEVLRGIDVSGSKEFYRIRDNQTYDELSFSIAYFVLLLYLIEEWDNISRPLLALECIVSDFSFLKLSWIEPFDFPSYVAGIGEAGQILKNPEMNQAARSLYYSELEKYVSSLRGAIFKNASPSD